MAAGLGTRMRREDPACRVLRTDQAAAAAAGAKGMIPIRRPFLEYVLSALADAGMENVVFVVAPGQSTIRDHFTRVSPPARVTVAFTDQPEPTGTADAALRAADVIGDQPFILLNADNYYPVEAYMALASLHTAGTVAFDRNVLVHAGNIDVERVRAFAVLDVSQDGWLRGIVEKPAASLDLTGPAARWVGMNLWAVTGAIIGACGRVGRSVRGEFELPDAVGLALSEGVPIRAVRMGAPVLDLSQRGDIPAVEAYLRDVEPRP